VAGGESDGVRRNAVFALAVQLTTSAFTAALTLYLVRALDSDGFGRFTLAIAVAGVLTLPADFGISAAAARFIAERRADRDGAAGVFAHALRLKLAVSVAVGLGLVALAEPVAHAFGDDELTWPLRGAALALIGQSLLMLVSATFVALGRISTNLRVVFGESLVETLASFALVLAGGGAAGAAFGRATGYAFGAALGIALVVQRLGRGVFAPRGGDRRELVRYAGALAVVDWAYAAFEQVDQLLIGALLTSSAVGAFGAPLRFATFLHYPGYAVANAVAPRLARSEGHEPDARAFASALRWLLILQAAMIPPLLVWATPITHLLLGEGYEDSDDVLRALTPYVFLSGLAPLVSLGANYLGEGRRRPRIALVTLAVNIAIDVALLRTIGVIAAAIGTAIAFAIYVPAHFAICARVLELPLRRLAVTLVRALGAAGVASLVLLFVGTGDLSFARWAIGLVGATAAFVAVLVAAGELRARELGLLD
jgi:O-antigen/teichoic acid export membrane protein